VAIPPAQPDSAPTTGAFASAPGPSSRFVRLSHLQWENTVADLFRGAARPGMSKDFLSEPIRSSFNNNGSIVQVTSELWQDYQQAAGELATAARDPKVHGQFLNNWDKDAKTFIRNFGQRAYRRPLTDAEVNSYDTHFAKGGQLIGGGDAFADGVELVVEAMLQSPHFLSGSPQHHARGAHEPGCAVHRPARPARGAAGPAGQHGQDQPPAAGRLHGDRHLRGLPPGSDQRAGLRLREPGRAGQVPTEDTGMPIDATGRFAFVEGEKTFNGAVELMNIIAAGKQSHECYSQHLFEYIYGRERARKEEWQALAEADTSLITEVGRRSRLKVSIKAMITDLVSTDAFLTRLP
jgi:Protein of unknown function (DUF1595)/Protein of unknown function (DUF1587)/Protein of unknown function (DUF1585)